MRSGAISGFPVRYAAPRCSIALSMLIVVALNIAGWAGLGLATTLII